MANSRPSQMAMQRWWALVPACVTAPLIAGCSDTTPAGPALGTLEVATMTTGEDLPDGYAVSVDGSDPVNLTNDPSLNSRWPSWSPDGTRIAFSSSRTGSYEVFVMNADGSEPTDLSNTPGSNDIAGWPQAWSPQ